MVLNHPSRDAWIACAVAAFDVQCEQQVAQRARRIAWNKWCRARPSALLWVSLISEEIQALQRHGVAHL
jgi:hypothetical protein